MYQLTARRLCPVCRTPGATCTGHPQAQGGIGVRIVRKEEAMGETFKVSEDVVQKDKFGRPVLVAVGGSEISAEEAQKLGLTGSKARESSENKARTADSAETKAPDAGQAGDTPAEPVEPQPKPKAKPKPKPKAKK